MIFFMESEFIWEKAVDKTETLNYCISVLIQKGETSMAISFDSNIPIYIQVMDYIKKEIVSGRLKPGDKVDSVRDLAMRFGVNPNTVQRSLSELEREGLLKSERTVGRFISENEELINLTREQMAFSCVSRYVREMRTLGFNGEQVLEQTRYYVKEKMNDDGE